MSPIDIATPVMRCSIESTIVIGQRYIDRCGDRGLPELLITLASSSEIDAATTLLPIAISRRIRALATADFLRPWLSRVIILVYFPGSGFVLFVLFVRVRSAHGESMPDKFGTCMSPLDLSTEGDKVTLMANMPYSGILVSGADAFDFLQAQLSNDLRLLDDRERFLSAWCNAKGRVICLLTVRREGSGYGMTLPSELAEDVLRRLTMFRFRSKVDFEINPATSDDLGIQGSVDDWLLDNLRAGRAEIWKSQSEEFTPHMLNLDLLGAVSFDKGCYPGQEIVARTHYRGATKRRTHRFTSTAAVTPGDKVSDGERDIGEVLNAIGTDLLAVIPSEKADDSLTVNGIALTHIQLEYL